MSWCVIPGKQDTHTQQKRERVTITRTSWRQQDQSSNGKYLVRKMHRTLTDNWTLPRTWRKSMNHNHNALQSLNEQAKYSHERLQLNRQTNLGSSTHITQIMNYRTWYNERNITKQYRTITMIEIRKLSKDSYYAFAQANHALQQTTNGDKTDIERREGKRSKERRKI